MESQYLNEGLTGKCWIVWQSGDPNTYRCSNADTPEGAAKEWVDNYGPFGKYEVLVSLSRSGDFLVFNTGTLRFRVDKRSDIRQVA